MPKKHGFKEQTKVESPKKAPKPYYDIGDVLKGSDLNERIERFITKQQLTPNSHQDQVGCTQSISTRKGFAPRTSIFQSTHPTKLSLVP